MKQANIKMCPQLTTISENQTSVPYLCLCVYEYPSVRPEPSRPISRSRPASTPPQQQVNITAQTQPFRSHQEPHSPSVQVGGYFSLIISWSISTSENCDLQSAAVGEHVARCILFGSFGSLRKTIRVSH